MEIRSPAPACNAPIGVKDAQVVLSQDGVETLWQVPDFSIDLEHKDERSVLVGQASLGKEGAIQVGVSPAGLGRMEY